MRNRINAHYYVGAAALLVFLLTGLYMAYTEVFAIEAGSRMLYRSSHIYLMLSGAMNVFIAAFWCNSNESASRLLSIISLLILISPIFMLLEFFFGARSPDQFRTWAYFPLVAIFASAVILLLTTIIKKMRA